MEVNQNKKETNGCLSCLGCFGIIFLILLLIGGCSAIFSDDNNNDNTDKISEEKISLKKLKIQIKIILQKKVRKNIMRMNNLYHKIIVLKNLKKKIKIMMNPT